MYQFRIVRSAVLHQQHQHHVLIPAKEQLGRDSPLETDGRLVLVDPVLVQFVFAVARPLLYRLEFLFDKLIRRRRRGRRSRRRRRRSGRSRAAGESGQVTELARRRLAAAEATTGPLVG